MSYKRSKYFTTSDKKKIKYSFIKKKQRIYCCFFSWFYVRHGWGKAKSDPKVL